jgi:hypothetical protein
MKIQPVGAEFTNAEEWTDTDRQTDRQIDKQTDLTKLIIVFRNFTNAPRNCSHECGPIFVSVAVKPYKTRI